MFHMDIQSANHNAYDLAYNMYTFIPAGNGIWIQPLSIIPSKMTDDIFHAFV